jgi:hypothetical protein
MKNSPLKSASFKISSIFSNTNSDLCVFGNMAYMLFCGLPCLRREEYWRREGFNFKCMYIYDLKGEKILPDESKNSNCF